SMITRLEVQQHFMYIFKTMPVDRHRLEDTELSSSNDKNIIESNMSFARRVAKRLIEEGRVWEDLDISAPFTITEFEKRVKDLTDNSGMKVRSIWVFNDLNEQGMMEQVTITGNRFWRFKYKIGTLTEKYSEAIGVS